MLDVFKSNSKSTQFSLGQNPLNTDHDVNDEFVWRFSEKTFEGLYKENNYSDFKIAHGRFKFTAPTKFKLNYLEASVELIFLLQGDMSLRPSHSSREILFTSNTHNLIYDPGNHSTLEFNKGNAQFISIQLTPDLFNSFKLESYDFKSFNKLFEQHKSCMLNNHPIPIGYSIQMILNDIVHSPWKGGYQKIFLHSKMLELLLLQLDQCREKFIKPIEMISDEDKMKILLAKQYIVKNYNQHLTISMIAKQIGTNEFTLKKVFKIFFGTTIFGYINNIKMDKAKKLLENKNVSITQVSEIVGYKNPQHFTTAFKKKFGVVPSKFLA